MEQLQFMGLLNGAGQAEQSAEWKNAVANGALDLGSLFGSSQPMSFLNSAAGQLSQQRVSILIWGSKVTVFLHN